MRKTLICNTDLVHKGTDERVMIFLANMLQNNNVYFLTEYSNKAAKVKEELGVYGLAEIKVVSRNSVKTKLESDNNFRKVLICTALLTKPLFTGFL